MDTILQCKGMIILFSSLELLLLYITGKRYSRTSIIKRIICLVTYKSLFIIVNHKRRINSECLYTVKLLLTIRLISKLLS